MQEQIKNIVVAGGGTAGWMSAALIKKVLPHVNVTLVESDAIGIIGVGEATIPPIQTFNQYLGIDEKEFLTETNATIKLAIQFENWRKDGESYLHTFGAPGANLGFSAFQHYWLKARQHGHARSLWDYDLNYLCSVKNVFNKINTTNPVYEVPYAYHFDSSKYGQFMRKHAEKSGVVRTEGQIEHIQQCSETGNITGLQLKSGKQISGDLFIDCTGIRALLIQKTLGVEYEDWSNWLCADTAIAVQTDRLPETLAYTRSIAHDVGWQWRIPLTHRNGNGIVFSSKYMDEQMAHDKLMGNLDTNAVTDPRTIKFKTGRTSQQWSKNVIAVGLSSGFLEPLESTSIHLIQSAIVRLLKLFPHQGISAATRELYNKESKTEYETIRDFIILHYYQNERDDSDFWQDMQRLDIPSRLREKMEVFKQSGIIFNDEHDIFRDASWLQVMLGQGIEPKDFHPSVAGIPDNILNATLDKVYQAKQSPLSSMLPHDEFLKQYLGKAKVA